MTKMPTPSTEAQAVEIAFLRGKTLETASRWDFAALLGEHINSDFALSPFLPFLRVGFTAGFFGLPLPDFERISKRCSAEDRRGRRGRKPAR